MIRNKNKTGKTGTPPQAELRAAKGLLRSRGKRITGQRTLILQIIEESEGHLDAEELYRRARRRAPDINLATIYRTLHLLEESGLVEPSFLSHAHRRAQFESKPAEEHYHFTCIECGQVIEFESPRVEQLRREVKKSLGVEFTRGYVSFEGYCAECKGKHN